MKTLHLELPVDLVTAARLDQGNGVSQEAAKLIALELFREDRIGPLDDALRVNGQYALRCALDNGAQHWLNAVGPDPWTIDASVLWS